jgi:hypothetical protein
MPKQKPLSQIERELNDPSRNVVDIPHVCETTKNMIYERYSDIYKVHSIPRVDYEGYYCMEIVKGNYGGNQNA